MELQTEVNARGYSWIRRRIYGAAWHLLVLGQKRTACGQPVAVTTERTPDPVGRTCHVCQLRYLEMAKGEVA